MPMEENNSEDFFDVFKNAAICKTKKFRFKKVEKNATDSAVHKTTTSPFFMKNDKTLKPRDNEASKVISSTKASKIITTPDLSSNDSVEEQLSKIFGEVSENSVITKTATHSPLKLNALSTRPRFNFRSTPNKNSNKKSVEETNNYTAVSSLSIKSLCNKNDSVLKNSVSGKYSAAPFIAHDTTDGKLLVNNLKLPATNSTSKFQFKKKNLLSLSKTSPNLMTVSQALTKGCDNSDVPRNSYSKNDVNYENDEDFKSESTNTKKFPVKKKEISLLNFNEIADGKVCVDKASNLINLNRKNSSELDDFISDGVFNTAQTNTEKKTVEHSNELLDYSSPIIKPKKFIFRKKLSTSSSNTLSQSSAKKTPEKKFPKKDLIQLSTKQKTPEGKKNNLNKECSYISLSSTSSESVSDIERDLSSKNVAEVKKDLFPKQITLDDEITFVSQSLDTTGADFMDDEEFERMFGEGNCSINVSNKKPPAKTLTSSEEMNLNNIDWDEQFEIEQNKNLSTNSILDEISDINWNEDAFPETVFTPANSYDTRGDDSKEFKKNYHFSEVVMEVLHQKFGLINFRPHQREVINASLNRHDIFVLMPTGGGKSLCYQLPAILSEGVTIVISPLRALISDQVDKLNALDISAAHLCSDISKGETNQILSKLHVREPLIKLLYLTPEKIVASKNVIDLLNSLYQRGKLARFIIDEAHCLSQWGHDFRPDYKQLSLLRKQFDDVPIICLTATATKQVEQDVINILKLRNVKRFIRSFNRPNIKYQVIPKNGKTVVSDIANLIKQKFFKKSGIIYCLARKDCDLLAQQLNSTGVKTKPYHAGMNDKVRENIQREWMQDQFHVIVATIAFGMGIDKPDVRFVIHNSIPKSVEAFYQESGRAGRDGETSYSYLFYHYGDVGRLQRLMVMDRNNKNTLDGHFENLKQMVSFAENVIDCRRRLQLLHLGENFDRQICIQNRETTCDNCENFSNYNTLDVTKEAKELGTLVQDLSKKSSVTLFYVTDVYRGSKQAKILDRGHDSHKFHGAGKQMARPDVHRILKDLILKGILADHHMYTGDFPVVYIKPGPKFNSLNSSNMKITISVAAGALNTTISYPPLNVQSDVSKPSTSKTPSMFAAASASKAKKVAVSKYQIIKIKVQCHEELLEECRRLALQKNVTLSSIMNLSALKSMSEVLPKNKEEILKIQHVTNANYNKYGEFFLKITTKFREQIDSLQAKSESQSSEDTSLDDDWCSPGKGVKRKSSWNYKKGAKKPRKPRKPRQRNKAKKPCSPKTKKGKKGGKGGGGLGLMPVHVK